MPPKKKSASSSKSKSASKSKSKRKSTKMRCDRGSKRTAKYIHYTGTKLYAKEEWCKVDGKETRMNHRFCKHASIPKGAKIINKKPRSGSKRKSKGKGKPKKSASSSKSKSQSKSKSASASKSKSKSKGKGGAKKKKDCPPGKVRDKKTGNCRMPRKPGRPKGSKNKNSSKAKGKK